MEKRGSEENTVERKDGGRERKDRVNRRKRLEERES
jgi:hypothetical protein